MLGVVLARFGYKESCITSGPPSSELEDRSRRASALLSMAGKPFDSKNMRYLHEYDSIENKFFADGKLGI